MANVKIVFNNKEYILSCDDGQEKSLISLVKFLDDRHQDLKNKLGNIGENKLLLITAIKIIDEHFDLKNKVKMQKQRIDKLSDKFMEIKNLAIKYKDNKDVEIGDLNLKIDKFKKEVVESQLSYETMLDKTTSTLEKILEKKNKINTEIQ